ncbi:MAG: hypothetical protein NTW08_09080 [Gammaproteobacteria bacterium]|nr:hypothetical protein [Gammaproteobacteria bacterium]
MNSLGLANDLLPMWERYQQLYHKQRIPKAMLLVCPDDRSCQPLIDNIQARLLCSAEVGPCGQCRQCYLFQEKTHPDLYQIVSGESSETIKVDAIRLLQDTLFLSSQVAERKIIYLEYLEQMTPAASNALLKTLEEPPEQVYFIAVTRQVSRILPTILSRFQQWVIPALHTESLSYLDSSRWTFKSPGFLALLQQAPQLVEAMTDCMHGRLSTVLLAEKWSAYAAQDLFAVLYCIFAERIRACHTAVIPVQAGIQLESWQCALIVKKIEEIMSNFQRYPTLQVLLTLETWLLDLVTIARMV